MSVVVRRPGFRAERATCSSRSVPPPSRPHSVHYILASKLVDALVEAADAKQPSKTVARYGCVDLLLLDGLGYMEPRPPRRRMLFQVLTEREAKFAIAVASTEPFSGWAKTFTDPRLCTAIVDRLTFNDQILEAGTTSFGWRTRGRPAIELLAPAIRKSYKPHRRFR